MKKKIYLLARAIFVTGAIMININESAMALHCPFIDYYTTYQNSNTDDTLPFMEVDHCRLITGRTECDMKCTVYVDYGDSDWQTVGDVELKNYPECIWGTSVFTSDSDQSVGTLTCQYKTQQLTTNP